MGTQALTLLYADQETGEAAGLDWSILEAEQDEDEGCDCGHNHGHDHDCGCDHHHKD